jgi:SAM-dependent MidA family methyltransferase|tara:strand:- start:253 stop:408 length:156 start_codon:yes stop_codon:yes gene_type:complete
VLDRIRERAPDVYERTTYVSVEISETLAAAQARPTSHWFPYDPVGVVNVDP